jgi:hypothetical protein
MRAMIAQKHHAGGDPLRRDRLLQGLGDDFHMPLDAAKTAAIEQNPNVPTHQPPPDKGLGLGNRKPCARAFRENPEANGFCRLLSRRKLHSICRAQEFENANSLNLLRFLPAPGLRLLWHNRAKGAIEWRIISLQAGAGLSAVIWCAPFWRKGTG